MGELRDGKCRIRRSLLENDGLPSTDTSYNLSAKGKSGRPTKTRARVPCSGEIRLLGDRS